MIEHKNQTPQNPERVVILGTSGFVGRALNNYLRSSGIETLALSSADLDLSHECAQEKLKELLKPEDSLIILSALTPDKGRGIGSFMRNLKMMETICEAHTTSPCAHVVYFSSDAVYPPNINPINELSPAAPIDLYGTMHRSRELMLLSTVASPLCILRPTLIYGPRDSHNSYGPNRFRRQAREEKKIVIGGEGEETRDHVYIDDVVKLTSMILTHKSHGLLNIATGHSTDFANVASMVAKQFDTEISICPTPRNMPVTHRSFDTTACMKAFPGFVFTPINQGIQSAHREPD